MSVQGKGYGLSPSVSVLTCKKAQQETAQQPGAAQPWAEGGLAPGHMGAGGQRLCRLRGGQASSCLSPSPPSPPPPPTLSPGLPLASVILSSPPA